MNRQYFFFTHILLFLLIILFAEQLWPDILLISAQIIFIPTLFNVIVSQESIFRKLYPYVALPAYAAVVIMTLFPSTANVYVATVYGLFTLFIALYGITRFIQRGFTLIEEFAIDCGLVFLFVGGLWYIAYQGGINTGFSPIITWLTAIHFHYSSSIMLIFIGFLGRIHKLKTFTPLTMAMIILPWIMALGITFSRWIELIGIIIYIVTVYTLILYSIRTTYKNLYQKVSIITAFLTIGMTIILAGLYILSNGFGWGLITIQMMLVSHGIMNTILFGFIGLIGWLIDVPKTTYRQPTFPLSPIRKKFTRVEENIPTAGLVESFESYIPANEQHNLTRRIKNFYENTHNYSLHARVKWQRWFLPFAFIYKGFSSITEQINLPLSKRRVEMTGNVYHIDKNTDSRPDVRAWVRKIAGKLVFIALYSPYKTSGRTYMNIALPLPLTAMHGILACTMTTEGLELTSVRKNSSMQETGIYLVFGKQGYFRLPLSETFFIKEVDEKLIATHDMQIFGLHFLTIDYVIEKKLSHDHGL